MNHVFLIRVLLIVLTFSSIHSYINTLLSEESQKIIVGPIIGNVTETTARILVQFSKAEEVKMILKGTNNKTFEATLQVKPDHPLVFKFDGLTKNTRYTISFQPDIQSRQSSFKTLSGISDNFKVVFLSCNAIDIAKKIPVKANLWTDLAKRAKRGEIDYIFHIGDQVYMDFNVWNGDKDNVYSKVQEMMKEVHPSRYNNYIEEARKLMRQEYIRTFSHEPMADAIALVPNIMMLDDHEIFDDFGYKRLWNIKSSFDYFFARHARYVYYQYERQLREDIDFDNYEKTPHEYFNVILNNIGFFVFDYRGSKTWHRSNEDTKVAQLGEEQRRSFKSVFSQDGEFKDVKAAVLVGTIPWVYIGHNLAKVIAKTTSLNDVKEGWNYSYLDELLDVFETIMQWKSIHGKEMYLIGGDVHMAGHTEIYYDKKPFIKQLVTSGINQVIIKSYQKVLAKGALAISDYLNDDYCFSHYNWVFKKNYGWLLFKNEDSNDDQSRLIINAKIVVSNSLNKIMVKMGATSNIYTRKNEIQDCGNLINSLVNHIESAIEDIF